MNTLSIDWKIWVSAAGILLLIFLNNTNFSWFKNTEKARKYKNLVLWSLFIIAVLVNIINISNLLNLF